MRGLKIISVLLSYFVFYRFNLHRSKIIGRRIREACEELGVVFIKFGQMLSTRYDILSERDCKELQNLFDGIKEIPYEKVREIFKNDFGVFPDELFEEFNSKPIASASIAQVYRARLKTGEDVAVKVRRPYVGNKIIRDMNLLINLMKVPQFFSRSLRSINIVSVVKEMKQWLLQEIDFRNEVKNMDFVKEHYEFCFNKKYRSDLSVGMFPQPYYEFCSENVITMDFIDGVPLNKIDKIISDLDYDIEMSLDSYLNATMRAFFTNNNGYYFQADPHPANILILKDGNVAHIDYGFMGYISEENMKKMIDLFLAVYLGNLNRAVKCSLDICNASYKKYAGRIKNDVKEYLEKTPREGVGFWFMGFIKIFSRHGIKVPSYMSSFGRCNFVLDGVLKSINPNKTTLDYFEKEIKSAFRKRLFRNLREIKYENLLYNLTEKIRDSPELVSDVIDKYYGDFRKFLL